MTKKPESVLCIHEQVCLHIIQDDEIEDGEQCQVKEICKHYKTEAEFVQEEAAGLDALIKSKGARREKKPRKPTRTTVQVVLNTTKDGIKQARQVLTKAQSEGQMTDNQVSAIAMTKGLHYPVLTDGQKEQIVELAKEVLLSSKV